MPNPTPLSFLFSPRALVSISLACALVLLVAFAISATAADSHPGDAGQLGVPALHPVIIRTPSDPPKLDTGITGSDGQPIAVSCQTCHATKLPNTSLSSSEELTAFHLGLHFDHGKQACASCHNPGDYNSLRLANGDSLPFVEVKTLCSQCHGPQGRDYEHGAHGGMSGYWDLTRGPRLRNSCVHCHDPHAPKYQAMLPAAPPADRFAPRAHAPHEAHHD